METVLTTLSGRLDRPGDEVCRALILAYNASSSALKLSQPIKLNTKMEYTGKTMNLKNSR